LPDANETHPMFVAARSNKINLINLRSVKNCCKAKPAAMSKMAQHAA
jgi:hypothetical protein